MWPGEGGDEKGVARTIEPKRCGAWGVTIELPRADPPGKYIRPRPLNIKETPFCT